MTNVVTGNHIHDVCAGHDDAARAFDVRRDDSSSAASFADYVIHTGAMEVGSQSTAASELLAPEVIRALRLEYHSEHGCPWGFAVM